MQERYKVGDTSEIDVNVPSIKNFKFQDQKPSVSFKHDKVKVTNKQIKIRTFDWCTDLVSSFGVRFS